MSRSNDSLPMLPPWLSESEVTQVGYEAPVENLPQDDEIDEAPKRRRFMGRGGGDDARKDKRRGKRKDKHAEETESSPAQSGGAWSTGTPDAAPGPQAPGWPQSGPNATPNTGTQGTATPANDTAPWQGGSTPASGPAPWENNATPATSPAPWQGGPSANERAPWDNGLQPGPAPTTNDHLSPQAGPTPPRRDPAAPQGGPTPNNAPWQSGATPSAATREHSPRHGAPTSAQPGPANAPWETGRIGAHGQAPAGTTPPAPSHGPAPVGPGSTPPAQHGPVTGAQVPPQSVAPTPEAPADSGPALPTRRPSPPSTGFTPLGPTRRPDLPPPPPLPDPPAPSEAAQVTPEQPRQAPPRLTAPAPADSTPATPQQVSPRPTPTRSETAAPEPTSAPPSESARPSTPGPRHSAPELPIPPASAPADPSSATSTPPSDSSNPTSTPAQATAPAPPGTTPTGAEPTVAPSTHTASTRGDSDISATDSGRREPILGAATPTADSRPDTAAPQQHAPAAEPDIAAPRPHVPAAEDTPAATGRPADDFATDARSVPSDSVAPRRHSASTTDTSAPQEHGAAPDNSTQRAGRRAARSDADEPSTPSSGARRGHSAPTDHAAQGTGHQPGASATGAQPPLLPETDDSATREANAPVVPANHGDQSTAGGAPSIPGQENAGAPGIDSSAGSAGIRGPQSGVAQAPADPRSPHGAEGFAPWTGPASPYGTGAVPQRAPGSAAPSPYASGDNAQVPAYPATPRYDAMPGDLADGRTEVFRSDDPRVQAAQHRAPASDPAPANGPVGFDPNRQGGGQHAQTGYRSGEFAQPTDAAPPQHAGAPHQRPGEAVGQPFQQPDGAVGHRFQQPEQFRQDGSPAPQFPQADGTSGQPYPQPDGTFAQPIQRPDGTFAQPSPQFDARTGQPDGALGQPYQRPDGTWAQHAGAPAQPYQQPGQQAPGLPPANHGQWGAQPPGYQQPSLDNVPVKRAKKAPGSGWRKAVHHVSGGAINPGMSAEERRLQELVARIRQPVRGDYRIAVLSLKGGVGKTTTTTGLGSIFASIRGDRVIAVDANPDFGTLSQRVALQTRSTVRDLLLDPSIERYSDVRRHTSQSSSRLEVLASERDPAASESFNDEEYRAVARILQRFYNIILTDCGTGLMHSAMSGVLDLAHSLVLISSAAIDGARSAAATLDWLSLHGHDHLVRNAVVVINLPREGSPNVGVQQLREYFLSRCRAVHIIPYDEHLSEGAEIDLHRLHKSTKRAYVELAATVADEFSVRHHRFG
ncbi:MinD/ParA family ATP-binding protein [Nocardia mangyaensis]|uniref:MinD/ParA family ATP-binding protein n=1 Tax=Nocardia mangyaensis TaxID=2213200 RepID=UPI003014B27C